MDFWEILAVTVSGAWAFFKTSSWVYMKKSADLERLYEAVEIGVAHAWKVVVKPWLEKNGGRQKLPLAVREQAERVAIEEAGKTDPIVKRYGCNILRATVKMAVEESKRRGGI